MTAAVRVVAAWSWLASASGAAVMLAPHVPLLVAEGVARRARGGRS